MHSAVSLLSAHNVVVGIGVEEQWSSRNLRFDIGLVRIGFINSLHSLLLKESRLLLKQMGR